MLGALKPLAMPAVALGTLLAAVTLPVAVVIVAGVR